MGARKRLMGPYSLAASLTWPAQRKPQSNGHFSEPAQRMPQLNGHFARPPHFAQYKSVGIAIFKSNLQSNPAVVVLSLTTLLSSLVLSSLVLVFSRIQQW